MERNFSSAELMDAIIDLQGAMLHGFERVDQRFERMDERFERMDQRFKRLEDNVISLEVKITSIAGEVGGLQRWRDDCDRRFAALELGRSS